MSIGVIGLGRMGSAIAGRLSNAGHTVYGYDVNQDARHVAEKKGIRVVHTIEELAHDVSVFWLMVPVGNPVDQIIDELLASDHVNDSTIIIDGGNSHFTDSQRRYKMLAQRKIAFLDCGTSGGLAGREIGFSLMVGGRKAAYDAVEPYFKAIAAPNGYGYVGRSGAGHYVKMVHNGIEYALLQAYAEGFQLIKQGSFKEDNIDLYKLTGIWQNGSVIRSWLLDLSHEIFAQDQTFKNISGEIAEGGTGRWTVEDAVQNNVPAPMIEQALNIRTVSRESGGDYATKIVALLRNKFGGHAVKKVSS